MSARPSFQRSATAPVSRSASALDGAVAALSFANGSAEATRRSFIEDTSSGSSNGSTPSTPLPPLQSSYKLPAVTYAATHPSATTTTTAAAASSSSTAIATSNLSQHHPSQHQQATKKPMHLDSTSQPGCYILSTALGPGFSSECITIAAKRGSVLVIVADRWDSETDSHFEWKIHFDRDADMNRIQANFNQGLLKVTVPRFRQY
ncbi:hypothetical protein FRC19_001600 [Serendipita sp. 401]|nr:hypothetical protein FRC19_001600 [Serendipita sp. 401]